MLVRTIARTATQAKKKREEKERIAAPPPVKVGTQATREVKDLIGQLREAQAKAEAMEGLNAREPSSPGREPTSPR